MSNETISAKEILDVIPFPGLILDSGKIVFCNLAAVDAFDCTDGSGSDIRTIWPDFRFLQSAHVEEIRIDRTDEKLYATINTTAVSEDRILVLFRIGGVGTLMLEPVNGYGSNEWLQEKVSLLVEQIHNLSGLETVNDIYRETVHFILSKLDIDRTAILLINHEKRTFFGTWGTDTQGRITDESGFEAPIAEDGWVADAFNSKAYSYFQDEHPLRNFGEEVGQGWNGMVNIWQGTRILGWIAADNLISQRPLTQAVKELLRLLASTVSQLVSFKESEIERGHRQAELEIRIQETTAKLESEHQKNLLIRRQLAERENLESLGITIAGIAHELNNPIGTGFTAATGIRNKTQHVREAFDGRELSADGFNDYLEYVEEATAILEGNLKQASTLISAFRKTAVDQVSDNLTPVDLKDLIETILLSQKHLLRRLGVQVDVSAPDSPKITSYPGLITQVFVNLITNSLKHAFTYRQSGNRIDISVESVEKGVSIVFRDNGRGIPAENLGIVFDSFYTSGREGGNSGLGLYIVKDIVEQRLVGRIDIDSVVGEHTEFRIFLPVSIGADTV